MEEIIWQGWKMREWREVRLGDYVLKIGSGATPKGGKKVYLDTGEIFFIRSQYIYKNKFEKSGIIYLTDKHANELSNVEVQPKDILLNITGDSVARVCQVPDGVLPARVNQHVCIIRTNPEKLDPTFTRYVLVSNDMQSKILSLASSGATRQALTKSMIENICFSIPPLPEQKAIAEILGALDDKIDLNRRMCKTLEATAGALFKSWFVDFDPVHAKMRGEQPYGMDAQTAALFSDRFVESELGLIPEGWKIRSLDQIADFLNGLAL